MSTTHPDNKQTKLYQPHEVLAIEFAERAATIGATGHDALQAIMFLLADLYRNNGLAHEPRAVRAATGRYLDQVDKAYAKLQTKREHYAQTRHQD